MSRETTLGIIGEGEATDLYIRASNSGIEPLCAMIDGLSYTLVGKSKKPWYRVTTVREWHQNELQYTTDPKRKRQRIMLIAKLDECLKQFRETGNVRIERDQFVA